MMRRMLLFVVASVLLVACATDDGAGDSATADEPREPAGESAPADDDTAATEPSTEAPGDTAGATDDAGDDATVDIAEAQPGTWPVGDAGTVTFALTDGRPVLEDQQAAGGFHAQVTEENDDEIQVDFHGNDVTWEFEVETDDGRLEIDIRQDINNAEPGTFEMEAGSFTFSESNGALTMDSIDLDDGWELSGREEDDDSLEFEAHAGDRSVDVEVELNGSIVVEIDYTVTGPLDG